MPHFEAEWANLWNNINKVPINPFYSHFLEYDCSLKYLEIFFNILLDILFDK